MTPKEELLYRVVNKEGPISYKNIELFIGGNCHSDGVLLDRLVSNGFISKKVSKTDKHGVFMVKKNKKAKRSMSQVSKVRSISSRTKVPLRRV